jgi:hypothetical protein
MQSFGVNGRMLTSAKFYQGEGFRNSGRRAYSTPTAFLFPAAWRLACHLGAILEGLTLIPVIAMMAIPFFIYRLWKYGCHEAFFNSKKAAGESFD